MTTNSENPATKYLGTTWQKIEGRFLLGTSGSGASKQTGGSNTKTITQANLPAVKIQLDAFSLSRGTMDITGNMGFVGSQSCGYYGSGSGVIYPSSYSRSSLFAQNPTQDNVYHGIGFQASRNWTGTTNTAQPQTVNLGSGQALDITPAYYTCHMWLRTS